MVRLMVLMAAVWSTEDVYKRQTAVVHDCYVNDFNREQLTIIVDKKHLLLYFNAST